MFPLVLHVILRVRKTPLKIKDIRYILESWKATTTATATKTTLEKWNSAAANFFGAYSILFNSSNVGNFSWSWILKDCIEVQEKKKEVVVLCSLPPQNVKLGRHSDGKEMYQKSDTCAKLLFCHFLPFSLTSPSSSVTYKLLCFTQKCTEGPKHVGAQHPFVCSFVYI